MTVAKRPEARQGQGQGQGQAQHKHGGRRILQCHSITSHHITSHHQHRITPIPELHHSITSHHTISISIASPPFLRSCGTALLCCGAVLYSSSAVVFSPEAASALDAAAAKDRAAVFPTQHLSAASRRAIVCCLRLQRRRKERVEHAGSVGVLGFEATL